MKLVDRNGSGDKTCGECRHWHKMPVDRMNIGKVEGECRFGPPHTTCLPLKDNQVFRASVYPLLGAGFMACSQHATIEATEPVRNSE